MIFLIQLASKFVPTKTITNTFRQLRPIDCWAIAFVLSDVQLSTVELCVHFPWLFYVI